MQQRITSWLYLKVLGHGSCATVYLALTGHPSLPLLAVKSSEFSSSDYSLIKERLILTDLADCPEVVRCFGRYGSNLLLEYADGGTLWDLIRNNRGRLREPGIGIYTVMILRGLRSIHEKGYVHCDLKPDNILAFTDPANGGMFQLKIADFGRAKLPGDDGCNFLQPQFQGTPIYMSPESVGKEGVVLPALDVWSLGCVVVEMFTGEPPMKCRDLDGLAFELGVLKIGPVIPETMSDKGKDFLSKCFEIDPEKRWTAAMLLNHPFVEDAWSTLRTNAGPSSLL